MVESGREEKGSPGENAVVHRWWDGVSNLASVYCKHPKCCLFFDNFLFILRMRKQSATELIAARGGQGVRGWSGGRAEGRGRAQLYKREFSNPQKQIHSA